MSSLSTEQSLPPGTVLLLKENQAHDTSILVLEPQPTNDPNDPLNWTEKRKWVNFGLMLIVTAVIFTALSIQAIFWQLMVIDLPVTYAQLINSYAIGLCGTATGCVFFIPFAIKYGRRPVYIISTAIMLAVNNWTAKMQTVGEIYATNILAGLAGATNETIVQMTIADLWFVHQRGNANGLYMIMVTIGSFLSPIGAGYMATAYGWRFCYNVLTGFMGAIFLAFIFFYEETKYTPITQGISSTDTGAVFTPVCSIDPSKKVVPTSPDNKNNDNNDIADVHLSNIFNHEIDRTIPMNTCLVSTTTAHHQNRR